MDVKLYGLFRLLELAINVLIVQARQVDLELLISRFGIRLICVVRPEHSLLFVIRSEWCGSLLIILLAICYTLILLDLGRHLCFLIFSVGVRNQRRASEECIDRLGLLFQIRLVLSCLVRELFEDAMVSQELLNSSIQLFQELQGPQ